MQSDPSDIILYWLQILSGGYFIDKINFNYSYRLKTLKRKFGLAIQPTIYYYLWLPSYARGKKISMLFSFFQPGEENELWQFIPLIPLPIHDSAELWMW